VTGIWPFSTNIFIDDYFLPSAVTHRPLQDNQNLKKTSAYHISNLYSDISTHPSTSGLKTKPSSSQRNRHHTIPVEIRPFPKADARKETRKRKDTPVKAALEAEVQARAEPVKCNRLFSDSQEKARTS
jgi:hypothetical protein